VIAIGAGIVGFFLGGFFGPNTGNRQVDLAVCVFQGFVIGIGWGIIWRVGTTLIGSYAVTMSASGGTLALAPAIIAPAVAAPSAAEVAGALAIPFAMMVGGNNGGGQGNSHEEWQRQVDGLEDKIGNVQQEIKDKLAQEVGFKNRVDGSMQYLRELMKELADLKASGPK
jgi:hypothetical protein